MHAQRGVVSGAPKNTASKFYRVTRESSPERDERVRALHERFVHRTKLRAAWEAQECRDIRAAESLRLWEECGCTHLTEYLMRTCGFTRREASERIRVAHALADLPRLEDELEAGRLAFSSVRELVRVVIADKQDEWIEHCAGMTSDQVARAVSGHKRGDSPDDPVDPNEHRHTITFSVRDSTRARFNAALRVLKRKRGHAFEDDDDLFQTITDILEMHSGPHDANANDGELTRDDGDQARAANDNDLNGEVIPGHDNAMTPLGDVGGTTVRTGSGTQSKSDGLVSAEMIKAWRKALARPPVHVWLMSDGRGFAHGVELPPHELDTLLCDSVNMGDIDSPDAGVRKYLSDRERARTLALWDNKCAVPGCDCETDLDIHHLEHLEDGGLDVPAKRVPLCKGHHRLHHAGKLVITGVAPYNVVFTFVTPAVEELDAE